jgi:hypothetical protein
MSQALPYVKIDVAHALARSALASDASTGLLFNTSP